MRLVHLLTLCAAMLAFPWRSACAGNESSSYVEYKGQKVTVARAYRDFDEYKDDPNNLSDVQARYAARLVTQAPFGPTLKDASELIAALDDLQFPGYGYFFANQVQARIDPKLELAYVELPRARANRYLVAELQGDGTYRVIADFVAPAEPEIVRVHRTPEGRLRYEGARGRVIMVPAKSGS